MNILLSKNSNNSTPMVIRALEIVNKSGGGEIHFEKGEYHFFKEGTKKEFFAISNNASCDKYMVFPILNKKNLIIDGHGSTFVFHDITFPFMISKSQNITIRNIIIDTAKSPLVKFFIRGVSEDGFYMDFDCNESPFYVKDGSLFFERERTTVSGKDELFSLHEVGCHNVQYFATGDCTADMSNLPAPLMKCNVFETPSGVYAKYRSDSPSVCKYENQLVSIIVDGKRDVDVICLDRSQNIKIENIKVARGIGMGIIGQLSTDIVIDGFCTDVEYHEAECQTLTADALHFVNCDGLLEIKNCVISDIMDDAVNVHGMYTVLSDYSDDTLALSVMHQGQRFFNPYREGDRLEIINDLTFEVMAELIAISSEFKTDSDRELIIKGRFVYGKENLKSGFWVENPDRMPSLYMHHNNFSNFPHIRISGAGKMLVENNRISDCRTALLCKDLAKYWYESGRIKHLVFRNNILEDCNSWGSNAFIIIGVEGIDDDKAPKIHETIKIIGNKFSKISDYAITAGGVKNLIVRDNIFDIAQPKMKIF